MRLAGWRGRFGLVLGQRCFLKPAVKVSDRSNYLGRLRRCEFVRNGGAQPVFQTSATAPSPSTTTATATRPSLARLLALRA